MLMSYANMKLIIAKMGAFMCKLLIQSFHAKHSLTISLLIKILLLFNCVTTNAINTNSQTNHENYLFEKVNVSNAFLNQQINCIYKDNVGFLWIGTNYGLYKYDGSSVKVFRNQIYDSTSLLYNKIYSIYEDINNNLWILGERAMAYCKYNRDYDNFTRYYVKDDADTYPFPIPYNKRKAKYLCTREAIFEFQPKNKSFERVLLNTNIALLDINSFVEDANGKLWIGSFTTGLLKFDAKNRTLIAFPAVKEANSYQFNCRVTNIFYDSDGLIWVGGLRDGINCFNPSTENYVRTWNSKNKSQNIEVSVANFTEDNNGHIWMATENGINIYNKKDDKFNILKTSELNPKSISSNNIRVLYKDNTSRIWIGSYDGYVNTYDPNRLKFKQIVTSQSNSPNLNKSFKCAFIDSKGTYWMGTDLGLNKLNKNREIVKTYIHNRNNAKSLSIGGVCAIHEDNQGQLWVGTWGGGLNKFNTENGTFTHYGYIENEPENPKSIADPNVLCIKEDKNGLLWLGTAGGTLEIFDPRKATFKHIRLGAEDIRALIIDDNNSSVWCTSSEGLFKVNNINFSYKQYLTNNLAPQSISDNYVTDVVIDNKGIIWATTLNGLNRFDKSTNSFKRYYQIDNIEMVNLYGLQIDTHNNLWFTNSSYLLKFNPASGKLLYYNQNDGIVQSIRYSNRISTGELVIGGLEGANIFYPDSIKNVEIAPKLVITDFKVFNKSIKWIENTYLEKVIEQTRNINLSYKDAVFGFDFTVLQFNSQEQYHYAYKLEGFDTDWNFLDNKKSVSFSNIAPGNYVLRVKSSNSEGYWSNNGVSVNLHISPPFWKTYWFRMLVAIVIVMIIIVWIRYKTYALKRRNERLERVVKIRTKQLEDQKEEIEQMATIVHDTDQKRIRFLINISHEFRTPLTLIINPIEQMLTKISANQEVASLFQLISKNTKSLLNLINQVLDMRKLETNNMSLEVSHNDLYVFLNDIFESFSYLAVNQSIKFSFSPNFSNSKVWFDAPKIERIIINLLSNAFKFTPNSGSIEVNAHLSDDQDSVKIEVKDTGIGISPEQQKLVFDLYYQVKNELSNASYGTGIGLNLAKELIELHHGSINVTSSLGHGSCFWIEFPIQKNAYNEQEMALPGPLQQIQTTNLLFVSDKSHNSVSTKARKDAPVVLIVEDNTDLRVFVKQNLCAYYHIIEAENGLIGYNRVCKHMPDLIISDILMPQMNGFELCEKVKTDESISHIPVILLTSQLDVDNQLHGLSIKADDYITKPFNIKVLKARIDNILDNRELMRKRFAQDFKIGPNELSINSLDKVFIQKAVDIVEKNISNVDFDVDVFSKGMALSSRQIFNKMKALTDLSPGDFIRNIRLKRAAHLISQSGLNISEIAYETGFTNVNYFSTAFKKQFGVPPSEYNTKNQ